jgi:hypothetical protein
MNRSRRPHSFSSTYSHSRSLQVGLRASHPAVIVLHFVLRSGCPLQVCYALFITSELGRTVPAARDRAGVFLPVEEQVRRVGTERDEAAAANGGGKPATEAHRGRTGGGHPGVKGGGSKKW